MPSTICQRTAIAAAISACFPAIALGAGVARVDFATGSVTAVAADGRSRALSRGSEINVGETVATQQGRAQLRFADGAYMSLQPQTEFKVEEFKYSGKGTSDQNDSIVMNLLKGGLRTITGLIGRANRNNYRLRTDVATIGIRGTEYSVKYTNSIEVFCADGSILVQNEGGTLQLNGGQGGYVASNQTPPQQTENRPVLPPESPTDQQLQEQQEQPADPVNPIQEQGVPPIEEVLPPNILTGTFTGNIAVAHDNISFGEFVASNVEVPIEFNAAGELIAFDILEFGTTGTQIASATPVSMGNDGVMAWGRWINGASTGEFGVDLSTEGTFHYVVGLPVTNMPVTGAATYTNSGHTTPSFNGDVGSASFTSSTLNVDFGQQSVSIQLQLQINQLSYNGFGSTTFDSAGHFVPTSLFESGNFCGSSTEVRGFLAGEAAARAGLSYHITTPSGGGEVAGAVVYQRGAIGPSQQF